MVYVVFAQEDNSKRKLNEGDFQTPHFDSKPLVLIIAFILTVLVPYMPDPSFLLPFVSVSKFRYLKPSVFKTTEFGLFFPL